MRIEELLQHFNNVKRLSGKDHYQALCPCHNDHEPSLDIRATKEKILMSCLVCNANGEAVMKTLGLDTKELFFEQRNNLRTSKPQSIDYIYSDTLKKSRFYIWDKNTGGYKKAFCWWHKTNDRWQKGLPKDDLDRSITPPLYKQNSLTAAKDGTTVYIVEGEKDVDTLTDKLGMIAVCSPHGAANSKKMSNKWKSSYNSLFDGLNVAIIPDNDEAGRLLAEYIALRILPIAKSVKVLNLRDEYPDLKEKGDITDVYESETPTDGKSIADITKSKIEHLTEITPLYKDESLESSEPEPCLITNETVSKVREERKRQAILYKPEWTYTNEDGETKIDEKSYITAFVEKYGVRCINNQLYSVDGLIADGKAKQMIIKEILFYVKTNHGDKVEKLLKGIKQHCYIEPPKPCLDKIHFKNGTLSKDEDGLFTVWSDEKEFCINRIDVNYNPDAPKPTGFLNYLNEVYHKDDQVTLQQYCGYCLLPTTFLQKALIIIGAGGEGKSVVGSVLNGIIGENNCYNDKVSTLESRFGMANLENKLLFIDDDLSESALKNASQFKKMVTNNVKISTEKKYVQNFEFKSYARLLIFGNFTLQALYDTSEGFTRRQIVLQAKPKSENRVDNPFIDREIIDNEAEGVANWLILGLNSLIANDYKIWMSERTKEVSDRIKREADSVMLFLDECGMLRFAPGLSASSRSLYEAYEIYCDDNLLVKLSSNSFVNAVKDKGKKKRVTYNKHITEDGKDRRGFIGVSVLWPKTHL